MLKDSISLRHRASDVAPTGAAARQGRLGTNSRFASTQAQSDPTQAKRERYALQRKAGQLLPREGVARCMFCLRDGVSGVGIVHDPQTNSAHYSGLFICGSVWLCPICAAKVTERRRKEIQHALEEARARGLRVVMLTYTFSHRRGDDLADMLDKMQQAFKTYRSGRPMQRHKERYNITGYIRALEVTYSEANGHHPHTHELVFLPADVDIKAFAEDARRLWESAAGHHGLSMNEHGFSLEDCDARVAEYVSKWGHEPKKDGWNEAAELSKWHIKKGRAAQLGQDEHVTPFGLLRYALAGDERAGRLFQEYARAFKGKHQLQWSRGLKALFSIDEKSDAELAQEEEERGGSEVAYVSRPAWRIVLANDCRAELLEVAGSGDVEQIAHFLAQLGICYNGALFDCIRQAA